MGLFEISLIICGWIFTAGLVGFRPRENHSTIIDSCSSIEFLESCDDFLEWVGDPDTSIADLEGYGKAPGSPDKALIFPPNPSNWNYLPPTRAVTILANESGDSNHPPSGSYIDGSVWIHPSVELPLFALVVKEGKWRLTQESSEKLEIYLRLYPNTRFNTYLTDTQIREAVEIILLNTLGSSGRSYYNSLTKQFVVGAGEESWCLPWEVLHDLTPSAFVEELQKLNRSEGGDPGYEKMRYISQPLTNFHTSLTCRSPSP